MRRPTERRGMSRRVISVISTGRGLYGVGEAACVYYGRRLGSLNLSSYALIAGMAQAPSLYDPRFDPALALQRRNHVLDAMQHEGYISGRQNRDAAAAPVSITAKDPAACAGA